MSGKSKAMKTAFHEACTRAVAARLGAGWTAYQANLESWSACFQRRKSNATHLLCLRLALLRHVVEIVLAIKRAPSDSLPRVWWEDRALHPDATGFAKVLWSGDLTYGSEQSISVPKDFWRPEFGTAIEQRLGKLRDEMEAWYAKAEAELSRGNV